MTDQRPRFGRGEEGRRGRYEEEASSVQQRGEGRDPETAHGGEGGGVGPVQRAWDSAELVLLLAATGAGEPGCGTEWPGCGRAEQAREGVGHEEPAAGRATGQERQRDCGDLGRVCATKKRTWGALRGRWVPHDVRDAVADFV